MKPQSDVFEIIKRTSRLLQTGVVKGEPAWFKAVLAHPPSTSDTVQRVNIVQLRQKHPHLSVKKLMKPMEIVYPEDRIRKLFYRQHPWELTRPRILVEHDALDFQRCDWSKIEQDYKALDGESVVQRSLWLMRNKELSQDEAYDIARKEFYSLRVKETIERQTAEEEARMFGAVFSKSYNQRGLENEAESLEEWKTRAQTVTKRMQSRFGMAGDEEEVSSPAGEGGL
ncbi:mitochondrial ribosomal protein S25-domain-containing protein [Lipomyces tetrasporus]|uniref:37S ribosomal protein S25, mitochondrial n=1 Tax=Lipomyces tetrasporus TaxID=54092 RepID=A0AAD7QQ16_9ASCO|nr:mitochondrial ribosomal protein S25-domain-containing protein [Lipomyces tetrasporus]KAJ8099388.1 mitochondrial ribosomal protein S25-domain-containing protein [Lipomyces tetrasporus]